jgi:sialate O-acetylesterase
MIHPLVPFGIKGALWYQGESNVDYPDHYARALKTMIESWRSAWGYDFAFYFAQIAPWSGYGSDNVYGAILRDQQRQVLNLTRKTGMVVLSDIGDLKNIHPGNKQDVGKKFAALALHHDYNLSDISCSGPLFRSWELHKEKIILHFDHAEAGLNARDGELVEFEVLDDSNKWIVAKAHIIDNTVEVYIERDAPRGIRFGFRNGSNANLFNGEGWPASCFELIF